VLEEVVRLGLDDRGLTARCREMRHALARYAENVPGGYRDLLAGREAERDVGSSLWPEEAAREGLPQLVTANCKRIQEALRVLEEFAKLLAWPVAGLKALRFAAYELEKSIILSPGVGDTGSGSPGRRRLRRRCRPMLKERCPGRGRKRPGG
jgi:thiamine-phosphate pyrophosphorylase